MPMELGSGIALGGLCVSAAAVAITAIRSKTAERREEPSGGKIQGHCLDHSGIDVCLKGVNQRLDGVDHWLGEISRDVKAIEQRTK